MTEGDHDTRRVVVRNDRKRPSEDNAENRTTRQRQSQGTKQSRAPFSFLKEENACVEVAVGVQSGPSLQMKPVKTRVTEQRTESREVIEILSSQSQSPG